MEENKTFNHHLLNHYYTAHFNSLHQQYSGYYIRHLHDLERFIEAYKTRFEKLNQLDVSDLKSYSHLKEFSLSKLELLEKSQNALNDYDYEHISNHLTSQLLKEIKKQKKEIKIEEPFKGYAIKNKANLPLFFKKLGGNISLSLNRQKKSFYNIFRTMFGKEKLDLQTYRRRRIPFQSMLKSFFIADLEKDILNSVKELMLIKSQVLLLIWNFDEQLEERINNSQKSEEEIDHEDLLNKDGFVDLYQSLEKKISEAKDRLRAEIKKVLEDKFAKMDIAMDKVDSPDLPLRNYKYASYLQKEEDNKAAYNLQLKRWENTHKTLLDDWSLDVEIALLYFSVLYYFAQLHKRIDLFISQNLSINIESLRSFLKESEERVLLGSNKKELKGLLLHERTKNSQEFVDKMLSKTIHKLSGSINRDLEKFKKQSMELVDQVSNRRAFVKSKNYESSIKTSDVNWLSPRELLNFEALPHFNTSVEEVEEYVAYHLEKSRIKLVALGTVSDFSLESAQLMLNDKKGSVNASKEVVAEGYGRALGHLEEAILQMDKIKVAPLEKLQSAINVFKSEIQKLKNTDNILELNVKIVQIKAIERSKKIKKQAWEFVLNLGPTAINFLKEKFTQSSQILEELKKKLGIVNEMPKVSHELSDFLTKTEESLKKLPFVYQRLYQLNPTNDERFFVGRADELEKLNQSYTEWQQEHFVITALIGEKGNGTSSILLYFLKQTEPDIPIIHHEIKGKIYDVPTYLAFFASLFEQDAFQSNDEIISFLNEQSQQIIILENLQHLFIKKVKGFVCQKMLFDLMTSTSKNVFWIGTYTSQSWEYLEKTLNISSVFMSEVHLKQFTDETLEQLIFKRNYLSGYQVAFEELENDKQSKSYQKLKPKEKQAYLKKSYFRKLNQMANGNVSLSQLYWLRSIEGIGEDSIQINSLKNFDVSFNKDLPSTYLFALHAILIHDGLNIQDYAKVFKSPEYICRNDLIPMLEKGLLIKPKEKYNINPIIFRQVVQLLKSHNFIN